MYQNYPPLPCLNFTHNLQFAGEALCSGRCLATTSRSSGIIPLTDYQFSAVVKRTRSSWANLGHDFFNLLRQLFICCMLASAAAVANFVAIALTLHLAAGNSSLHLACVYRLFLSPAPTTLVLAHYACCCCILSHSLLTGTACSGNRSVQISTGTYPIPMSATMPAALAVPASANRSTTNSCLLLSCLR